MDDFGKALLQLAIFSLAFVAVVVVALRLRRRQSPAASPRSPRRAAKASRASAAIEPVEIAPARLARISGKAAQQVAAPLPDTAAEPALPDPTASPESVAAEMIVADDDRQEDERQDEERAPGRDTPDPLATETTAIEEQLDHAAHAAAERAQAMDDGAGSVTICLVPQIPPRNAALTKSWLGGRPRLPATMDWPQVDGRDGDFLAQIGCADLPRSLWGGLGPRQGSLGLFVNPDSGAPRVLHWSEDGPPRDPPRAPGICWAGPADHVQPWTLHVFPQWPIDLRPVIDGEDDPRLPPASAAGEAAPGSGYDIGDPAFHPFDWDSMLALAALLESRIDQLPRGGANADVPTKTREIIAIIRDTAGHSPFTPADASAVLSALHAIRWTPAVAADAGGGDAEWPLTRHHPHADLWVGDYLTLLTDRAKHAWCANPNRLGDPARAFFEPLWAEAAAREMATMADRPDTPVAGFDPERDILLFHLPASPLMNRRTRTGDALNIAIRKADLAAGDFSKLRTLPAD